MSSKLSEAEVMVIGLKETTWDTIKGNDIKRVYIRAHSQSPMYGPYRVVDVDKCMISKMDGTQVRSYPRDKGLYADPMTTLHTNIRWNKDSKIKTNSEDLTWLKVMITELESNISTKYREIEKLEKTLRALRKARELYEATM